MWQEIELKLDLSANAADALLASPLLKDAPSESRLRAIYFDTPDRALAAQGVSLRIRRSGRKRTQTIKVASAKAAGLFARPEWEMRVDTDIPILDDRTPIPALLGDRTAAVGSVFEVVVQRLAWTVAEGGASVEIVLDRGAAIAGDRRSAICELELELKHGDSAALFDLAHRIAATVPVRLGILTKAERGGALLGPAPTVFKAEPMLLDRAASAAEVFQTIARMCLRQYRLNETLLLERSEPEALHQARVALRRLRSCLSIFTPLLHGDRAAYFQGELRWLAGVLGDARNLDVLVRKARPGTLRDALDRARDEAYAAVGQAIGAERATHLMLDLAGWLAVGGWRVPPGAHDLGEVTARTFASRALGRLRGRIRKRGKALDMLGDEERHEIRKTAKKLRYAAEFFHSLFPDSKSKRRHAKFVDSLEELQDRLGMLNDLATAPEVLGRLDLLEQKGAEMLLGHRKKSKLIGDAVDAYDDLMDRKKFWK